MKSSTLLRNYNLHVAIFISFHLINEYYIALGPQEVNQSEKFK